MKASERSRILFQPQNDHPTSEKRLIFYVVANTSPWRLLTCSWELRERTHSEGIVFCLLSCLQVLPAYTFRRYCFLPSVLSSSFPSLDRTLQFIQFNPGLCLERRFCPSLRLSSLALSETLTGSSGIYLLKSLGLPTFPDSLPCSVPCQFWGCEEMTTSLWPREEVVRHDLPQQQ